MLHSLWQVVRSIGVADLLDMAVVSGFIYLILLWFELTKAAFVARGILILGALYILARQLGMVLTTWIFHGFFAVFVVALVIIFQEEIRRFFERIAVWRWRNPGSSSLRSEQVEILLQSVAHYAREHIGALIVLRGRDPLERHIDGGVVLDGKLSTPLLQSIFDIHSEGHDGAVLLQDERVHCFGAHLPLSKNLEKLAGVGTRHAAALGISEVSDAFAIVVSEQRGTISVAQNGEIQLITELHELESLLSRFLIPKTPVPKTPSLLQFFTHKKSEKIIAIGVSFGLWLIFVQGFKPDAQAFNVAVQVQNVSEGLRVRAMSPHRVLVTLRGLKRDLDALSPNQIKVLLNAEGRVPGTEKYLISEDNVKTPELLRYVSADPPAVELELSKVQPKIVVSTPVAAPPEPSAQAEPE